MPNTATEYAQTFMMHRTPLLELLEKIPADQGSFTAWEGGRSITELVDHMASTTHGFGVMATGGKPERLPPSPDFPAALQRIRTVSEKAHSTIAALSEAQLTSEIQAFGGRTMPVYRLLDFLIQHEAHHKGQLWVMARMIGLEPPMFVKFE